MKFKKIVSILMLALCFISISYKTFATNIKPTNEFYVNDYANLLSEDVKQYIINSNIELNRQTGAQIIVVTVPSLGGRSLEEFATELFREFGIGDKEKNNGLLLLLALDERKFRVEVGYGLEGLLPDAKTGRIQDEFLIPYLKENKWDEGIKNVFSVFLKIISDDYNATVNVQDFTGDISSIENDDEDDVYIYFMFIVLGFWLGKNIARKTSTTIGKIFKIIWVLMITFITFIFVVAISNVLINLIFVGIGIAIPIFMTSIGWMDSISTFISSGSSSGGGSSGGFSGGGGSSGGGRKFKRILKYS